MIEEQLAELRKRVANLEAKEQRGAREAWKQMIGTSKGHALDREAAKLGAAWRAKENKRK